MYTFCIEWFFNMFSVIIYVNNLMVKKYFIKHLNIKLFDYFIAYKTLGFVKRISSDFKFTSLLKALYWS